MTWDTEAALLADVTTEIRAPRQTFAIEMMPATAFQLAALLQLALKHPGPSAALRAAGRRFLEGVRMYFGDAPAILETLRRGDASPPAVGATGQFPRGPADATDEGELRMAMAADHQQGIVRIVFGKPIAWLGLPSADAREMAAALLEKADELDRRRT